MDAGDLERLRSGQRRQDPRQPPGEHRLARSRRPHQQEVVRARSRDLERTAGALLAANVREIGDLGRVGVLRQWLEGGHVDLAAKVRDHLAQRRDRNRLDAGEGCLGCRLGRADHAPHARPSGALGHRQRPGDRPDSAVERELAHGRVLGEPLGWELPRCPEHGEGDREIEPGAFLAQCRGSEIDRDPAVDRPLERCRHDAAAYAVLRLLAGAIGEPDDGESRHARLEMRLDLHLARLEADECVGDRPSEHPREGRREGVTEGSRLRADSVMSWRAPVVRLA
jgi:hypothetical protein